MGVEGVGPWWIAIPIDQERIRDRAGDDDWPDPPVSSPLSADERGLDSKFPRCVATIL